MVVRDKICKIYADEMARRTDLFVDTKVGLGLYYVALDRNRKSPRTRAVRDKFPNFLDPYIFGTAETRKI